MNGWPHALQPRVPLGAHTNVLQGDRAISRHLVELNSRQRKPGLRGDGTAVLGGDLVLAWSQLVVRKGWCVCPGRHAWCRDCAVLRQHTHQRISRAAGHGMRRHTHRRSATPPRSQSSRTTCTPPRWGTGSALMANTVRRPRHAPAADIHFGDLLLAHALVHLCAEVEHGTHASDLPCTTARHKRSALAVHATTITPGVAGVPTCPMRCPAIRRGPGARRSGSSAQVTRL